MNTFRKNKASLFLRTLYFIAAISVLTGCEFYPLSPPRPSKGVLDLRFWDLHEDGPVKLAGEWEILDKENTYYQIGHKSARQASNYSRGKTVMARLKVINNRIDDCILVIYSHASHIRIVINGKEAITVPDYRRGVLQTTYPLKTMFNSGAEDEICLYITDDGFYDLRCLLGSREDINRSREISIALEFFIIITLILNGLYHIFISLYRRWDWTLLWFAILSFVLALRASLKNEKILVSFIPSMGSETILRLDFLTLTLILPLVFLFNTRFYPGRLNRLFMRSVLFISMIYSVIILVTSSVHYRPLVYFYEAVIVFSVLYILMVSIRELFSGNLGAFLGISGIIIFLVAMTNDILNSINIINTFDMSSSGLLLYIGLIAMDLSFRSLKAFDQVTELSNNLENEVVRRTAELQDEKDRLFQKNVLIEKEFELAWRIQREMIPLSSPVSYIHALYKPLQNIGGDFYDYLRFRNSDRIGIFVSDVSGHGVPASLVTSMLKTMVLQAGPRREEPAELIRYLNNLLIDKTGGNFITALYVIYDPHTRELVYSNAGHYFPLVIDDKGVFELEGVRSAPLAIFDNDLLDERGKSYGTSRTVLPEKCKLLLYTDGLIEATNTDRPNVYFEDAGFRDVIYSLRNRDVQDFIAELYGQLVGFRGNDVFEDDVCVICLEIN